MARNELKSANDELAQLNNQLSAKNEDLSEANRLLSDINGLLRMAIIHLNDSNRVKEEYIGKFLSICSGYIDKLDNYRIKVNRKLKAGQQAELYQMTKSEQLKEDELKELFAKQFAKEGFRVIRKMPKWIPGTINGKNVRTKYSIPITFRCPD